MIRVWKSEDSKNIFISGVTNPIPVDDFSFVRDGDLFSFDRISATGLEVNRVSYTSFTDDQSNSFASAADFESYLNTLNQRTVILEDSHRDTVSDHSDVNLNDGVAPVNGWVPKWVDGSLKLCMKEQAFYNGSPVINQTGNPLANTPVNWNFNFQRIGTYKITFSYAGSIDSTGADIVTVPSVDNQNLINITSGESERREGKDSAGNDADGRGTDQKDPISVVCIYQATSAGTKNVKLDHYARATNTPNTAECSLWNVIVEIEEVFNLQITS